MGAALCGVNVCAVVAGPELGSSDGGVLRVAVHRIVPPRQWLSGVFRGGWRMDGEVRPGNDDMKRGVSCSPHVFLLGVCWYSKTTTEPRGIGANMGKRTRRRSFQV